MDSRVGCEDTITRRRMRVDTILDLGLWEDPQTNVDLIHPLQC